MILAHVHELRNERAEEHQHFWVGEQHHKTLQEKSAARRGRRCIDVDACDPRADQLDAEPDQIGGACKAHPIEPVTHRRHQDRKSTRLNSSHMSISYAVFCLKKKKKTKLELCNLKIKKKKK